MKKKNWQKTPDEKAIHRRAVINEALDAIAVRDENGDRVSDITIRKIRKILQGKGLM